MIQFFALLFVAGAIAGATAFVIFWPLALIHLRDRYPQVRKKLGVAAFIHPAALKWLISGEFREIKDRAFTGLATPAQVSLIVIVGSLIISGLLWLLSKVLPA